MTTVFIAVTKGLGWVTLTIKTNLLLIILEVLGNGLDCLDPDKDRGCHGGGSTVGRRQHIETEARTSRSQACSFSFKYAFIYSLRISWMCARVSVTTMASRVIIHRRQEGSLVQHD